MAAGVYGKIEAFEYLNTQKSELYRPLMRHLYEKQMSIQYFNTSLEQLYDWLKEEKYVDEEFTKSELEEALRSLERWGNVKVKQDNDTGPTIEEYINKRYLYQITTIGKSIEEFVIKIDEFDESITGSLDSYAFKKLLKALSDFRESEPEYLSAEYVQVRWNEVFKTFQSLSGNSSSYLALLQSAQEFDLFKVEYFMNFKDKFIQYLGNFVNELNRQRGRIVRQLKLIDDAHVNKYVEQIVELRKVNSWFDETFDEERFKLIQRNKWSELKYWFIGRDGEVSEVEMVSKKTKEAVTMISRYANRLSEIQSVVRSRKDDFRTLARWFSETTNVDEAHRIYASAFGVAGSRKIQGDKRIMDSEQEELWYQPDREYITPNQTNRGPRKEKRKSTIRRDKEAQKEIFEKKLARYKYEEQEIKKLIRDGKILLKELENIEPFQRKIILKWIKRNCNPIFKKQTHANQYARTQTGLEYTFRYCSDDRVVLNSTDGTLKGYDIEIVFKENQVR
ncbi:TIGR02677 family protein [Brevibacillus sp. NPDC058079]|uniref:TIGR02677 family protein n=1 Tax=Brevibacillus sp. NPDC058079 TaxID=3346330 RepID=UPI0036EA6A13